MDSGDFLREPLVLALQRLQTNFRPHGRKQASREQDIFDPVEFLLESHKSRVPRKSRRATRSIERICVSAHIRHEYRATRQLPHPEIIDKERDDGRKQLMALRIHIRQINLI